MPEGIQYEDVELRVFLPEGAREVKFETSDSSGMPTSIESSLSFYKTYLDTVGRTVLTLRAKNVADEARGGNIIVRGLDFFYHSLFFFYFPC